MVNFVRNQDQVVPATELGHAAQFLRRPDAAAGRAREEGCTLLGGPMDITLEEEGGTVDLPTEYIPDASPLRSFLQMLVPLIVFFLFQRYFVAGIMGGSVKG